MIFPIIPRKAIRDPFDPALYIDREVGERGRRLVIGLALEPDFRRIAGGLIVTGGNGKYLNVIRSITCVRELPELTTGILKKLGGNGEPSLLDIRAVQEDIAIIQSSIVEELKRDAGKYVDRLLVISIADPGIWLGDSGDDRHYIPICDPNLLADATGISVIDAFPARDISAGGSGLELEALPAWLSYADRSPKSASKNRVLITIGKLAHAYFLPASDGLDMDIPEIRTARSPGLDLIMCYIANRQNEETQGSDELEIDIARLNVEGKFDPDLAESFETLDSFQISNEAKRNDCSLPDCVRTLVVKIVEELAAKIRSQVDDGIDIHEILVDSPPDLLGTFVNQIQRTWPESQIQSDFRNQGVAGGVHGVLVAALGAMSIDQMPANVPWITGANSQRILGRLTPGSPTNWRHLLREMADFQPPAMRLRDAI